MATAVWDLTGRRVPVPVGRSVAPVVRRRITLLVAGSLVVGLLLILPSALDLGGTPAPGQAAVEPETPPIRAVVAQGDTIWDLAAPYVPEGMDLQSYVAEVIVHNQVDPGALEPGSVLDLPQR